MVWFLTARRERRLAAADAFRSARRLVDEDVTVLGEELTWLHEETLTTPFDDQRVDHQRALDHYEDAKSVLAAATTTGDVTGVERVLVDGRYHLACVLARRDGVALPHRRDPCFFNPQHGPAIADVAWTPPGGVEREVPVCRRDLERLEAGQPPDVRLVRVGDRYVPWHEAGGTVAAYGRHRAHVMGTFSPLTDRHVAEAHTRADTNIWGPPRSGGLLG